MEGRAMDFIKAQYERIQQQLNGLSASQRMLTFTMLVIMGITLVYWVKYAGKPEMEALLDQPMAAQDLTNIRMKLDGMGIHYEVTGDRILVPSEKKDGALAALYYDQALPSNTSTGWDAIVKQINPWNSEAQNAQWWLQAKQAKLAEVIRGFPDVADANVIIDATDHRGFGDKAIRPSATINIKMREGRRANKKLVMAAADMVAGSQAGLDRGRIKVVVNGVSYPVQPDGPDSIGGGDELVDIRQMNEAYYSDKIAKQLGWMQSEVFVSVAVDINGKTTDETSTTYDPKGGAKIETKIRSKTSDESSGNASADEPGVGANTQASLGDGGGGAKQSHSENEDETEFQSQLSSKQEVSHEAPGKATVMSATVRVPHSYFVRVYKEQNPNAKNPPDDATLQPAVDAELKKIRTDVKNCAHLTDDSAVAVETYYDTVISDSNPVLATTNTPTGMSGLVGGHAKEIALGVLAVVSLFMMATMVKKGAPAPVVASVPVPEGPPVQLAAGEEVVGEAGDGETILGGMELDEDAAKTQQMLGQVSDLVKDNPDAAANLIKRWMNK